MQKFKSTKQPHDLKKALSKFLEAKRDCTSRLRSLRILIESKDSKNGKEFFISNFSIIYNVFYDTFIRLDAAKFGGTKMSSDDDRLMFYIFEKILVLLPELLEKRWQLNSTLFVFRKCLHPSNHRHIRAEAMRLFLIYYQILGEATVKANPQIEILYASLVPGIVIEPSLVSHAHPADYPQQPGTPSAAKSSGVEPYPVEPFMPAIDQSSSISSLNATSLPVNQNFPHYEFKNYEKLYFTQCLLDYSITQCSKIYWRDYRDRKHLRGFEFLFSSFARIYLPYIFPKMAMRNPVESDWHCNTVRTILSIYNPPCELPALRRYSEPKPTTGNVLSAEQLPFIIQLQAIIVHWFTRYLLGSEKDQGATLTPQTEYPVLSKYSNHSLSSHGSVSNGSSSLLSSSSFSSSTSLFQPSLHQYNYQSLINQAHEPTAYESEIVRQLLNSRRFYVDLLFSLFHETFQWPFTGHLSMTMRNVIKVFKQWIYKENEVPVPLFLAEPTTLQPTSPANGQLPSQMSNDDNVCAGLQNMYNIFIHSSASIFLLEVPPELSHTLEIQVDVCKRVFNIYRFMVMKIEMDKSVWFNLVQVLIQITRSIVSKELPKQREDTLGGRLAPALFQTLIVTWIKANLNVQISNQLWERFYELVSSLTQWEELISEWSNTMFILNRVMSRYVFNINLNDLPLDKTVGDRKKKLRSEPRLHHIRSVSTAAVGSEQVSQSTLVNNTTGRTPETPKKAMVQRFVSNDSSCSESISGTVRARAAVVRQANLVAVSLLRHREYHQDHSLQNRQLQRSVSDSCLVTSVQRALCNIRSIRPPPRRRSKRRHRAGKKMPMIDDEIEDEGDHPLDMALNGDLDIDECDNSTTDEFQDESIMLEHLKRRTLFRCLSTTDLPVNSTRRAFPWSDLMAETMSIGTNGGAECNSLKDTPLAFDSTSAASTCSSSATNDQMCISSFDGHFSSKSHSDSNSFNSRPVLLGGSYKGWNAEISAILWRRMLGVLGDLNQITNPNLHKLAFECLAKITEDFIKIKDNISYLSGSSCEPAAMLQPSLHYYTAWLFEATNLSNEYKAGKMLAFKLLCLIAVHRCEQEVNRDFLILFYLAIKRALASYDMELVCIIIRYCGTKFFSSALLGSSCLLFDFISAANMVVGSSEIKYPRVESLNLLGSLIGFFDIYSNVLILKSTTAEPVLEVYRDLKEHVLEILISASKREQTGLGRSISFCSLGIFLYKEFLRGSEYYRLKEIVNILVAGTRVSVKRPKTASNSSSRASPTNPSSDSKFNNRTLCRVACDMLRLQCDHAHYLVAKHPDLVRRILEGLCYTLSLHIEVVQKQNIIREFKNLLLSIMFCLSHWCMAVPKDFLLNTLVSRDYPNFVEESANKREDPNEPRKTLLDLIFSIYFSIARFNLSQVTRLDRAEDVPNSFNEMDTIDYTVYSDSPSEPHQLHQQPSPARFSDTSATDNLAEVHTIKKAANLILLHFLNFLGHFPFPHLRTASLSSLVNENNDNPNVSASNKDKVDLETLNSPNVLVFVVNEICLISFIELPADAFRLSSSVLNRLSTSDAKSRPVRVIIRNVLGKFSWDCLMLRPPVPGEQRHRTVLNSYPIIDLKSPGNDDPDEDDDDDDEQTDSFRQSLVPDSLGRLLGEIHETSPGCRDSGSDNFLHSLNQMPEAVDTVALFINQHYQESRFNEQHRRGQHAQSETRREKSPSHSSISSVSSTSSLASDPSSAFQSCRQLVEQMGFLAWEQRHRIDLLAKNQSTVRELRHLDGQTCRDKHKIAVIYVGPGQETKESILLNKSGSRAFEEFVSRLGWEVNLATHVGFMGGLQANLSTGFTAPYYADSFNEVIYHVSTRLEPVDTGNADPTQINHPLDKQQLMNLKMRHLGNDEVHIIWSEHYKEYRRSILATEFGDALIVIYPLPTHTYPNLYRVQVSRKPEVQFFGPLFNGAVVHRDELPGLVRATAINASRAKRLHLSVYKPYFEERYDSLHNLATKYRERTTFEDYATRIYAPRHDLLATTLNGESGESGAEGSLQSRQSGVISLEKFMRHTAGLISSPCNADSISLASSGPPTTVATDNVSQSSYVHQPVMQSLSATSSVRGSRPTSRSSFTQRS